MHGSAGLDNLLTEVRILVCLLPLTDQTRGIIDAGLLSRLAPGAYFVNVGRGGHIVERDLLAALDEGRIAHATLDVFSEEPLPAEHAFWAHPRITVTPHVASLTVPVSAAVQISENLRRLFAGASLLGIVNREAGY